MSVAAKGKQPWLGKKHTPETRAKIAEANRRRAGSTGYWAIHKWVRENFAKTGICEECGKVAGNQAHDWSSIEHRYTRERKDWRELCRSCHKVYDYALRRRSEEVMSG